MDDRLSRLESRLDAVEQQLHALEQRLVGLQEAAGAPFDEAERLPAVQVKDLLAPGSLDVLALLSLVGRTLLVLGGAFLLRTLTESGLLPEGAGLGLGIGYALAFLLLGDRAAAAGARPSAAFHGLASALVAYPLAFEAVVRFHFLSPPAGAVALSALTGLALLVAWRRSLAVLAWIAAASGVATSVALMGVTGQVRVFTMYLALLGVATFWLGHLRGWVAVRWGVALVVDTAVVALAVRVMNPAVGETAGPAMLAQLLVVAAYIGSFAIRTLALSREVIPFEVVQTIGALVSGFGGAVAVAWATGANVAPLGVASLFFGAVCYVVAFRWVDRRQAIRTNFYFYSYLGVVLVLVGASLALDQSVVAIALSALAVVIAAIGTRYSRVTLLLHASLYVLAAAAAAGLLAHSAHGLLASSRAPWPALTATAPVVLLALFFSVCLPAARDRESWGLWSHLPKLILASLLVWVLVGSTVALVTTLLARAPGAGADAGVVAMLRTAALVSAVLVTGWAARYERFFAAGWLVYPLLIVGGIKLVIEDFPQGRPATLFVALALYGAALIAGPRLVRRARVRPDVASRPPGASSTAAVPAAEMSEANRELPV